MIVPMKKVTVFTKEYERTDTLLLLRKLGVMHIETQNVKSDHLDDLIDQRSDMTRIIERIEKSYELATKRSYHRVEEQIRIAEVLTKRNRIIDSIDQEQELVSQREQIENEIERISGFGSFDPQLFSLLHKKGLDLAIYLLSEKELSKLDDQISYIRLSCSGKKRAIAVLGAKRPEVGEHFVLPAKGIDELETSLQFIAKKRERIEELFIDEARYLKSYREVLLRIDEQLRFENVKGSMASNGPICWITGFVPEEQVDALKESASSASWALLVDEVTEEDPVPTKLKNNAFVRLIQPVFDILGTVPGYREYDVSMFFMIFFSIFFAMIIGDAGYGMIFLIGTAAMHAKQRRLSEPLRLLYVLSSMTVIWGSVTGTWFGSDALLASSSFLKGLVIPGIATFPQLFEGADVKQAQNTVMFICFILGILQLSIACIVNFLRELPELKAIAQLGWLLLLVGLYLLVLNLVLSLVFPSWGIYLIGGGLAVFVLFSNQERGVSFPKGILLGLAGLFNSLLDAIGGFSNIISYIRLFAVGMASVTIASSFNSMAAPLLGGWAFPAAILILLLGHGLNLIMGILSVAVHGIRLNMLEFSGQLSMEWTGIAYEPFEEHIDSSLDEDSK